LVEPVIAGAVPAPTLGAGDRLTSDRTGPSAHVSASVRLTCASRPRIQAGIEAVSEPTQPGNRLNPVIGSTPARSSCALSVAAFGRSWLHTRSSVAAAS